MVSEIGRTGKRPGRITLGHLYYKGEGVDQDKAKAADYFEKAAEQGYSEAQFEIAKMYANGDGVEKDTKKAAQYFRKAAMQGNKEAYSALKALKVE